MTSPELRRGLKGKRGSLATQPLRFVDDLRPTWVALEEVPAVLSLWKLYRNVMADWGYSAWCGIVNAADFGVPQRRKRAVLLASRVGTVGGPVPTHTSDNAEALFGFDVAAVSMRNVLDLPIEYGHLFVHSAGQFGDYIASLDELSPTVAMGKNYNNWRWTVEPTLESWEIGRALTTAEVGLLQSFPVDYPWSGTRVSQFQQVSNAVPPLLAEKLLACVMASTYEAEADRQSDEAYAEYLAAMESEAQAGDPKW